MSDEFLRISELSAGYGDKLVVSDCNLAVAEGEFVGIVGPNGCGKSTFMKSIFGLITPWKGEVALNGTILNKLPPKEVLMSGMAMVLQGGMAFGDMTVRDNLRLAVDFLPPQSERRESMEETLARFPALAGKIDVRAAMLSGGQRQQLALSRALATRPRILLLDEPSLGLSPNLVDELMQSIAHLKQEGLTVLIIEHKVMEIMDVVDRLVIMRDGGIASTVPADEFLRDEEAVAAFLG